eukprot:TRINITY_DN19024_c0_g1_i1.p1 TRINITY_DN19024_c0_g1~~TRINITY_DN19024_c0_g1_i1.p1  ORF type:complete len:266 (-),score=86.49 TRINITY_DN19024_c0_g1_i1:40-837(-)
MADKKKAAAPAAKAGAKDAKAAPAAAGKDAKGGKAAPAKGGKADAKAAPVEVKEEKAAPKVVRVRVQTKPRLPPPKVVAPSTAAKKSDVMRKIKIDKVIVNICVGESGDKLTRAGKVLEQLTGQKPVTARARITIRSFGIKRNEKIGVHTSVRGNKALEILEKGLKVKEYELKDANFSQTGTFGFGIDEHIDLGLKYDPSIGIYGMDFFVVLSRPGFRVSKRKRRPGRVGNGHKITKAESVKWFESTFDGIVLARGQAGSAGKDQ